MRIPEGTGVLVKQENNNCNYQNYDGTEGQSNVSISKIVI